MADATGLTTATVRYYEQIGLLPEAARTASGHRTYDQRTLDHLAFINRAKQLGCTLEEITGLTIAWEGGQCEPLQDQLGELVASKIVAAEQQAGDLVRFAAELREAAAIFERHRPVGACDAECGCATDPAASANASTSAPRGTIDHDTAGEPAVACTLAARSMHERIADWQALLTHAERRERIDGGVRCVFDGAVALEQLTRLVVAEHDCCRFFAFAITVDDRGIALEVRAPDDARSIVEAMFDAPARAR